MTTVGGLVYQFFEHHLKAERGLSQASIRSYRDGIRLFLLFMAKTAGRPISKLALSDLSADNVRAFLTYLEAERGNNIRARNHRLAMLHTFFRFVGGQAPELLHEAERVAAIPRKRSHQRHAIWNATRSRSCSPACRETGDWRPAIRLSSCFCTIPAHAQRKSSVSPSGNWSWHPRRASISMARATSGGLARCGPRQHE
jgi:integrase